MSSKTGCVGSQTQISRVGHVHFIFFLNFLSISFALGSQFPVEYGLQTHRWILDRRGHAVLFAPRDSYCMSFLYDRPVGLYRPGGLHNASRREVKK